VAANASNPNAPDRERVFDDESTVPAPAALKFARIAICLQPYLPGTARFVHPYLLRSSASVWRLRQLVATTSSGAFTPHMKRHRAAYRTIQQMVVRTRGPHRPRAHQPAQVWDSATWSANSSCSCASRPKIEMLPRSPGAVAKADPHKRSSKARRQRADY
jgi:hypothetical protein